MCLYAVCREQRYCPCSTQPHISTYTPTHVRRHAITDITTPRRHDGYGPQASEPTPFSAYTTPTGQAASYETKRVRRHTTIDPLCSRTKRRRKRVCLPTEASHCVRRAASRVSKETEGATCHAKS